jgi:hypothetical protein
MSTLGTGAACPGADLAELVPWPAQQAAKASRSGGVGDLQRRTLGDEVEEDLLRVVDQVAQHDRVARRPGADRDHDHVVLVVVGDAAERQTLHQRVVPALGVEHLDGDVVALVIGAEPVGQLGPLAALLGCGHGHGGPPVSRGVPADGWLRGGSSAPESSAWRPAQRSAFTDDGDPSTPTTIVLRVLGLTMLVLLDRRHGRGPAAWTLGPRCRSHRAARQGIWA